MIKYFVINIEAFQKGGVPECLKEVILSSECPLIVLDESSKIKTSIPCREYKKSLRTQAVKSLSLVGERAILTGTLMSKSPCDAYDQLEFLRKGFWGMTFAEFADRYTMRVNLPVGRGRKAVISAEQWGQFHRTLARAHSAGREAYTAKARSLMKFWGLDAEDVTAIYRSETYSPYKNIDELWSKIKKLCMVVRKKDVTDLPEISYVTVRVKLSDKMKRLYSSLLETGFAGKAYAGSSIAMYHLLQDLCNGYIPDNTSVEGETSLERVSCDKIDALKDVLESIGLSEHQVIIWANRTLFLHDIAEAVEKTFGIEVPVFDGSASEAERSRIKSLFQSRKLRAVCINQQTGSYGLDELGGADYAVYMSSDYSVEKRVQSENRIDRYREDRNPKTIIDIECAGTIDEKVAENLKRGVELIGSASTDLDVFKLFDDGKPLFSDGKECVF